MGVLRLMHVCIFYELRKVRYHYLHIRCTQTVKLKLLIIHQCVILPPYKVSPFLHFLQVLDKILIAESTYYAL